ncbi:DUF4238 domain-containing protein [Vreelandella titanicae]|uniref:DUF4238 domain-containing protein n=1 Tax=Vreelandella titanicae TaxID=664683 RepID=UPI0016816CAA|nr:DUF4238 domain-containing protein [Halomonas titanicae]QNU63990.1 DUF4238 domain-containing protein [Halomonas titanicae]
MLVKQCYASGTIIYVMPCGKFWSFELNLQKKKKQHFVWRKYLEPWSETDRIYCLMDGRIFKSGLMGVGQERYFYKLKELTEAEIKIIQAFIDQDKRPLIRKLNHGWIDFFNQVFKIRDLLDSHGVSHPEVDKMLDVLVHNFEEDFHGRIESDAIKFLEMLYRKDLSFYDDENELIDFLFFICQQYFRTQNIDSKVQAAIGSFNGFNIDAMWAVLRHTSATSVGFSLYQDRANFRPVLIDNTSNIPFVTGDQPVINTHAIGLSLEEIPSELEFYYPLTPKLALLLTSDPDLNRMGIISIGEEKVAMYNRFIHSQAGKQVYSSERAALEQLLNGQA